jgi:lipid II:glycine glycyltransferase (peptidoglycan interpeptide bridge formation enzyme)
MQEKKAHSITTSEASSCRLIWSSGVTQQSEELFSRIPRSNLLQSPAYGQTMARLNNQRLRQAVILMDGEQAGIVQLLEAGLFNNRILGAHLDRGPLLLENYGRPEHFEAFLEALRRDYPKKFGRKMRFIPECEDIPPNTKILEERGFKRASAPYRTLWLDLRPSMERLRAKTAKNWRGALKKAENQGIELVWDGQGSLLAFFLAGYQKDKAEKKYDGPSPRTLSVLTQAFLKRKNAYIGCASLDGEPLAGVLIICHGKSATYQAGWTTQAGRERCAHHLLLWEALRVLKERAIDDFDLGGINETQSKGVKAFKEGLGGTLVQTPGLWT